MSSTISNGTTTITPEVIDGWEAASTANNIVHQIIGTTAPAITLRPAGLRAGTMKAVMGADLGLAQDLETILRAAASCTFADTDNPTIGFDFVVTGTVDVSLDNDTREVWIVTFGFQEIA